MGDQGDGGKEKEKEISEETTEEIEKDTKHDPRANYSRSRADTPRDLGLILSKMKIQEGHGPQELHPSGASVCVLFVCCLCVVCVLFVCCLCVVCVGWLVLGWIVVGLFWCWVCCVCFGSDFENNNILKIIIGI